MEAKLKAGGKVADVGCGHGASTIIMAGYPNAKLFGFDPNPSINTQEGGEGGGVGDRITFSVASSQAFLRELRSDRLLRLPSRHGDRSGR